MKDNECRNCGEEFPMPRAELGYELCLECGDAVAKKVKHTILTPHKQGAMFFTQDFAREAAKGIGNKGGFYR